MSKKVENHKAKDEHRDLVGNHSENLYDQNEDAAGERVDLATGKPFDNNGLETIQDQLSEVKNGGRDALPDLPEEEDAAAAWLRENDPNHG